MRKQGDSEPVLSPGDTCWRLERATRAAVLIDNADFFSALFEALRNARRSILILGWAFDPRTRLAPDGNEGPADADEVGRVLKDIVGIRPELDVRLLIWKSSLAANGSYDFIGHRAAPWFARSSIRFRLDDAPAIGACHHQKVIVIDDQIAFCGGGDIVPNRWDTWEHLADNPRRLLPEHLAYPPRHEVTVMVQGDAAKALGDLFRERWLEAGEDPGANPRDIPPGDNTWPLDVPAQFRNLDVGIARTKAAEAGRPAVQEVLRLTISSIRRAKRLIYLENQYFTSGVVADALAARLTETDGPEIVLVLGDQSPSWFDRFTMDFARNPLIRKLQRADAFGRFRVYAARTAKGGSIRVHSKVSIFDDAMLRVGSANLNNRSGGFDSECELAIEARTPVERHAIAAVRTRLISHFLGETEMRFSALTAERGTGRAIDVLNVKGRLAPLTPGRQTLWEDFVSRYHLGDPRGVEENWRLFRRRVGADGSG